VLDQLPEDMRPSVGEALRQSYGCGDAARAKRLLGNLIRRLHDDHPSAAASLEERLGETLTMMRFDLPRKLERVLCTINPVENPIGFVRRLGGPVTRWRDGRMSSAGLSLSSPTRAGGSDASRVRARRCSSSYSPFLAHHTTLEPRAKQA
jgi:hypothetical protein